MKKIIFSAISILFISAAFVACNGNKSNDTTETSLGTADSTAIVTDTVAASADSVVAEPVEITDTEVAGK